MGHKVHPYGFRIGVIRDWHAKWYADKHYAEFLQEDLKLREGIQKRYSEAAVSQVEIERQANKVSITIYTARPGIVIGRGGQRVDETRAYLEDLIGKKVQLNIQEIQRPELDAYLVAKQVAEQIERRIAFRRAMKQTLLRTMQAGAKGMKVSCSGRLGGAEIARRLTMHEGQVPLHTLRADIDYGFIEAKTNMGRIGVKVWIYKGDILPEAKEDELEEGILESVAEVETEAEEPVAEAPVSEEKTDEPAPEVKAEEEKTEEEPAPEAEVAVEKTEEESAPEAEVAVEEKAEEPVTELEPVVEDKTEEAVAETEPAVEEKAEESVTEVEPEAAEVKAEEEKPAKPAARKRKKATTEEPEEKAGEEPAEEEKPAKPAAKRKTRAKAEPKEEKTEEPVAEAAPAEEEENSAAT